MDRKAALLAGRVVQERETIIVTQDGMGEHWSAMVEHLDMSTTPPQLRRGSFAEPSENAVLEYYTQRRADQDAKLVTDRQQIDTMRQSIDRMETALASPMVSQPHYTLNCEVYFQGTGTLQFDGWKRNLPSCDSCWGLDDSLKSELQTQQDRRDAIVSRNSTELQVVNDAAFAAALPELRRRKAQMDAESAEAEAKAEAAKKAANAIKYAARLESGYWERETDSYNERRHSAPWCAKVTFPNGPKAVYEWGESTGKWGKAGILRVPCKPGEFIAWGQKDTRRPSNSSHYVLRMRADGSMESFDNATDAWKSAKSSK